MKNWDSKKDKCDQMRSAEAGGAWAELQDQRPDHRSWSVIWSLILVCDLWKGTLTQQAGASLLLLKQQVMSSSLRLC